MLHLCSCFLGKIQCIFLKCLFPGECKIYFCRFKNSVYFYVSVKGFGGELGCLENLLARVQIIKSSREQFISMEVTLTLCSLWNNLTFQWIDLQFNYSNRTIRVVSLTLADTAFKVDKYFCSSEMSCIEMMSLVCFLN